MSIIIIGAGSAGMACAVRAAQLGKKVLVMDKAATAGGTLHLTAGHLSAAGTKKQAAKNIVDDPQQHYADIAHISRNTMDATVAKLATELAPDLIDWLDDLGYPFHEKAPAIIHGHEPYTIARTYFGVNDVSPKINQPGNTVLHTLLPEWERWVAAGLIQFLPEHQLLAFKVKGHHIDHIVVSNNGEEKIYRAEKYVLCTGGYAANPQFFQSVTQDAPRLISTASPNSTGDGIVAAMAAGAVFGGGEKHSSTLGGMELEPGSGRANFWEAWARVSNGVDRPQREIYVNASGQRFMNEFDWNVDERERIVLQQTGRKFWLIFDQHALMDGACVVPQWTHAQLMEESKKEKAVWQANDLAILAAKIGLPAENLLATVQQYNGFVAQQKDEVFGRTYLQHNIQAAPFYALLVYAYSLISFGGLKVNAQLQVMQRDGTAFANLFAAGEILGAAATSGHAFCGGMLLTPALSFGKWLGEKL
jgi:succinate dehydrogenase/fumarate reductase flavoprotein subunit